MTASMLSADAIWRHDALQEAMAMRIEDKTAMLVMPRFSTFQLLPFLKLDFFDFAFAAEARRSAAGHVDVASSLKSMMSPFFMR